MSLPLPCGTIGRGAQRIADLLTAYFAGGGQCVHVNCMDAGMLRDALAHPTRYPDLQIRVCGWNVLWRDLSETERRHFVATAEWL